MLAQVEQAPPTNCPLARILGVFTQPLLFLILFLWCLEIQSQRDANLPTSFLPLPHLQTQIAAGQSQAFLYAEPVTGVTHHSPHVPSLTSSKPHSHSDACMKLCDWFGTVLTIQEWCAGCLLPFACGSLTPPLSFPSLLTYCGCMTVCVCVCVCCICAIVNCWLQAYYFKMSPAPALIPVFFREG